MQQMAHDPTTDTCRDDALPPCTCLPSLPVELCIMIIDAVHSEARRFPRGPRLHYYDCHYFDLDLWPQTFRNCASVCRSWYARCAYHYSPRSLSSPRQVAEFRHGARGAGLRDYDGSNHRRLITHVDIRGSLYPNQAVPHLNTFLLMFAQQPLRALKTLELYKAFICFSGSTHLRGLWCMSLYYTGITCLQLTQVTFATPSHFAALVSALPNLYTLHCTVVRLQRWTDLGTFGSSSRGCSSLREVMLLTCGRGVCHTLAQISKVSSIVHLTLSYHCDSFPQPESIDHAIREEEQRLLDAHSDTIRDIVFYDVDYSMSRSTVGGKCHWLPNFSLT